MPIFEFQCAGCAHQFEALVIHSSPPPSCPSCGATELGKVLCPPAVSSSGTRSRNLEGARKRANRIRYAKDWERHKQEHDHDH